MKTENLLEKIILDYEIHEDMIQIETKKEEIVIKKGMFSKIFSSTPTPQEK